MVVQFSCPGCQQPIEVDREWAGQHVACPFCQRVVTAPTDSTITSLDTELPHPARKLTPMTPPSESAPRTLSTGYNRLAVVGLAFSLAAVLLVSVGLIFSQGVVDQLEQAQTTEQMQEKYIELMNDPESARRIILLGGSWCLGFACWLTGLVVSAVAVTRRDRPGHRLAVAGIASSVLLLVFFCTGLLFG